MRWQFTLAILDQTLGMVDPHAWTDKGLGVVNKLFNLRQPPSNNANLFTGLRRQL